MSEVHELSDPASWWRTLCWVTDRLIVTGDLPFESEPARRQLAKWVEAGVTHVVDVRRERNDEAFVKAHAPHVEYLWAPTHDYGGPQPDSWFAHSTEWILKALAADPEAVVLVHCHMGVNRAPSLAMAVLLEMGYSPTEALDAIRTARPIAGIEYADQASDWFHYWHDSPAEVRWAARHAIDVWHLDHPVDVSWVISRIAQRGAIEEMTGDYGEPGEAA